MWVKNHGGKKDDVSVLKDHIELLIHSNNEEHYDNVYANISVQWSKAFFDYFEKKLSQDIKRHACKFITNKFEAFKDGITCTNNIAESFNKMVKAWNEW